MKKTLLMIILIFSFIACETDSEVRFNENQIQPEELALKAPEEPIFTTNLKIPVIPITSIHIIQREYFYKYKNNPNQANTISELDYLENRLIELYPEVMYKGLLHEIRKEVEQFLEVYNVYLLEQRKYEKALGLELETSIKNAPVSDSIEEEAQYMSMSQTETDNFKILEKYSKKDVLVTREELDVISKNSKVNIGILGSVAGVLGIGTYRVFQSWNRAVDLSEEFYTDTSAGTKGDAFRHIYVSLHLKRYLSQPISAAIMGANEVINSNDYDGDKAMDLHNNKLGRVTRYRQFIGAFFADRNNWRKWGRNIRDFLNGPCENGIPMDRMYNWSSQNPVYPTSISVAKNEINPSINSRDRRYVYYKNTCEIDRCRVIQCRPGYICVSGTCVVDPNYNECNNCRPGEECINGQCRPF